MSDVTNRPAFHSGHNHDSSTYSNRKGIIIHPNSSPNDSGIVTRDVTDGRNTRDVIIVILILPLPSIMIIERWLRAWLISVYETRNDVFQLCLD